jgi:hypothetical protein
VVQTAGRVADDRWRVERVNTLADRIVSRRCAECGEVIDLLYRPDLHFHFSPGRPPRATIDVGVGPFLCVGDALLRLDSVEQMALLAAVGRFDPVRRRAGIPAHVTTWVFPPLPAADGFVAGALALECGVPEGVDLATLPWWGLPVFADGSHVFAFAALHLTRPNCAATLELSWLRTPGVDDVPDTRVLGVRDSTGISGLKDLMDGVRFAREFARANSGRRPHVSGEKFAADIPGIYSELLDEYPRVTNEDIGERFGGLNARTIYTYIERYKAEGNDWPPPFPEN